MARAVPDHPEHQVPPVEVHEPSGLELFLEKNLKAIVAVLILAILAGGAYGLSVYLENQHETEAGILLGNVKTIEDCDLVVHKFPKTIASGNAILLKANFQLADGKRESAIATLNEFLAANPNHPLISEIQLNLGTQYVANKENEKARNTFQGLIDSGSKSAILPSAYIQVADLFWSEGKLDEAKAILEQLPSKFPGKMSAFTAEVEERIKMLNGGIPQTEVEAPAPEAPKSAPAPEAPKPAPAPEAPKSAPAPEAPKSAPAPEAPKSAPAPEAPKP